MDPVALVLPVGDVKNSALWLEIAMLSKAKTQRTQFLFGMYYAAQSDWRAIDSAFLDATPLLSSRPQAKSKHRRVSSLHQPIQTRWVGHPFAGWNGSDSSPKFQEAATHPSDRWSVFVTRGPFTIAG